MKNSSFLTKGSMCTLLLAFTLFTNAQVGINAENPKVTLDVEGRPTDTSVLDGISAPRITGDQLRAKTYTVDQNGTIVFATAAATVPDGQVVNVKTVGYYYFNSVNNVWVKYLTYGGEYVSVGERKSILFDTTIGNNQTTENVAGQNLEINGLFKIYIQRVTGVDYNAYIKNTSGASYAYAYHSWREGESLNKEEYNNKTLAANQAEDFTFGSINWDSDYRIHGAIFTIGDEVYEVTIGGYKNVGGTTTRRVFISVERLF